MSLGHWVQNTAGRLRDDGLEGLKESVQLLYQGGWRIGGSRLPLGMNIYERDWDVLVILDGCRTDLMHEVAPEQSFTADVDSLWSVGSTSREWLAKTFTPPHRDEVENTVYVTANPYTDEILSPGGAPGNSSPFNPANWESLHHDDFQSIHEIWKDGWDDDLGTVPPRRVTDCGINAARDTDPDRLILHYMQPHQPFIPICEQYLDDNVDKPAWLTQNNWYALRDGLVSKKELWDAYRGNLEHVMADVSLLLDSIDAERVVLTADHGNALGEWKMYGHPNGFLHPSVKRVPWVETTASDTGEYEPSDETTVTEQSVDERLESLGYL